VSGGHRRLPLAARLAGYRLAHASGRPRQLPVNLTVSVTYSCPSRCATCDIWQKKVDDLSVDEYARIFPTLEKVPVWVTLSGGDQFIRVDFDELVRLVCTMIEPRIVNIPMNGVITERIFQLLPKIAHHTLGAQLVLNLSVDEIGEAHDRIRGAERNFEKLLQVAELIHDLKKTYRHVVLGVHTVISKLNVHRIPDIEREARAIFRPDSYIAEVAENRVELKTMDKDITPDGPTSGARSTTCATSSGRTGRRIRWRASSSRCASNTTSSLRASSRRSGRSSTATPAGRARSSRPTGTCGAAACVPSRSAMCATMATISAPCGTALGPTHSGRASARTSARARSPTRATRTCCSTRRRSRA